MFQQTIYDTPYEQTIQSIQDFFTSFNSNFKIKLFAENKVNDYYSCQLNLYYNQFLLVSSNGKGCSKLQSHASAYAELYERFCGRAFFYNMHHTASIAPLSKSYTFNIIENDQRLSTTDKQLLTTVYQKTLSNLPEKKDIFTTLSGDLCTTYWLQEVQLRYGTNGMAAGNTFNEAKLSSYCELIERYISLKLYYNDIKLYKLNKNFLYTIIPNHLIQLLNDLEKNNIYVDIYDASSSIGLPALIGRFVNKRTGQYLIKVGCFPHFDIALTRIFTEAFQNRNWFNDNHPLINIQPFSTKNISPEICNFLALENFRSNLNPIDLTCFLNCQALSNIPQKFNHDAQINVNNLLYQLIQQLQEQQIEIYTTNLSLSDKIYAVFSFSPQLESNFPYPIQPFPSSDLNKFEDILNNATLLTQQTTLQWLLNSSPGLGDYSAYYFSNHPLEKTILLYLLALSAIYQQDWELGYSCLQQLPNNVYQLYPQIKILTLVALYKTQQIDSCTIQALLNDLHYEPKYIDLSLNYNLLDSDYQKYFFQNILFDQQYWQLQPIITNLYKKESK